MADTVDVPGIGKAPKKELGIGIVVVIVLVGVYFYRKQQSTSAATTAASSATTTDQYPPDGTTGNPSDPYSTDPATGATYGDENTGSGGTYGAYGYNSYDSSSGVIGYDSAGNPVYAPGYQSGGTTSSTGGPPFSTNSAWSQYAISTLQASNSSLDVAGLTDALGLYLAGQPVSPTQKQLIFDAIAVAGDPPVAGPNNYPPNVQMNGTTSGTGSGGSPGPVTGPPAAPTGMQAVPSSTSAALSWKASTGATSYNIVVWVLATAQEAFRETISGTTTTAVGLKPGTQYDFYVQAVSPKGVSQPANGPTFTTTG